jgi:hypothetical protein
MAKLWVRPYDGFFEARDWKTTASTDYDGLMQELEAWEWFNGIRARKLPDGQIQFYSYVS